MFNLSTWVVEIPPRSLLCSINGVDVVDSWTPDSSVKKQKPKVTTLDDLGVKIETDNLTQDQICPIYFLPVLPTEVEQI